VLRRHHHGTAYATLEEWSVSAAIGPRRYARPARRAWSTSAAAIALAHGVQDHVAVAVVDEQGAVGPTISIQVVEKFG